MMFFFLQALAHSNFFFFFFQIMRKFEVGKKKHSMSCIFSWRPHIHCKWDFPEKLLCTTCKVIIKKSSVSNALLAIKIILLWTDRNAQRKPPFVLMEPWWMELCVWSDSHPVTNVLVSSWRASVRAQSSLQSGNILQSPKQSSFDQHLKQSHTAGF